MDLHYISDTEGRHTAVVIPIKEWNNLTDTYKELKTLEKPKQKLSAKYAGKLSADVADQLQDYVTQGRNEWNNHAI